jgi:hypothetical protein
MTRGNLILITNSYVFKSCQFNGDMYPDGHGRLALELLERVKTVPEFYKSVILFNELNHKYTDEYMHIDVLVKEQVKGSFDMSKDYFENWFSDWLYIKNIGKDVTIGLRGENEGDFTPYVLSNNSTLALNFGRLPDEKVRNY